MCSSLVSLGFYISSLFMYICVKQRNIINKKTASILKKQNTVVSRFLLSRRINALCQLKTHGWSWSLFYFLLLAIP